MILLVVLVLIAVIGGAVVHADSWLAGLAMVILVPAGIFGVLYVLHLILHIH